MMTNHQDLKPNSIAKRFKFNNCDRRPEESIAEYIAEMRQLVEHCNYRTIFQDMLQDWLACGFKHESIQQHLLSEGDTLTLKLAIDIAQAMESVIKQSLMIKSTKGVEDHTKRTI